MKKTATTLVLLLFFVSLFAQKPYRGAEVYSTGKVLYGKFEMRMKMIKASGMLSTFYTIQQGTTGNSSYWGELDIEVLGKDNAQIMSTNIFADNGSGGLKYSEQQILRDYSLAEDYHTYTLVWTPLYVSWSIDGVELRRETGAIVNQMNVAQGYRFNAWISSTPAWVGPIDKTSFPRYQYVDWIEYSSYNSATQGFTKQWRDDFDSFNIGRWSKAQWTFSGNEVDFIKENVFIENGKLVLAITDPSVPLSIPEKKNDDSLIALYISESNEILITGLDGGDYRTQLYDMTGKVLFSKEFNTESFSIPCSNFTKGVYVIAVKNKGEWFKQKIMIK